MVNNKTCDKCAHYTPDDKSCGPNYANAGSCALMGDSNLQTPVVAIDRVSGYDYAGHSAGCYVGPKFGCIHWSKRK